MNIFRRITFGLLLVLFCSSVCAAQSTPCSLKVEQLPDVRGFKLGMTLQELRRRHPNLPAADPDVNGYAVIDVSDGYVDSTLRPPAGEGVRSVVLAFLDGKLQKFRVTYSGLTEWSDVNEFLVTSISHLKLPDAARWKTVNVATRQLDCDGASIQVRLEPKQSRYELQTPSIAFVVHGLDKILADREQSRVERQQRRLDAPVAQHSGSDTLSLEVLLDTDTDGVVPAAGATCILLDADPLKLFEAEDVRLTRFLSEGEDEDQALVAEFLSALRAVDEGSARGGSGYLKEFYADAMPALKPHIIQIVKTDASGKLSFSPIAGGTYFLIGGAAPPKYAVWSLKVQLAPPQTLVKLTERNTMAGVRTAESDKRREQQRQQEMEKRRRIFKP